MRTHALHRLVLSLVLERDNQALHQRAWQAVCRAAVRQTYATAPSLQQLFLG